MFYVHIKATQRIIPGKIRIYLSKISTYNLSASLTFISNRTLELEKSKPRPYKGYAVSKVIQKSS
jgi:hypothetical protein